MKKLLPLLLGALVLAGCVSTPSPPKPTVLVYGDSLTVLSEQAATAAYSQYNIIFRAAGGTAPCDWAPQAYLDRQIFKPVRVIIAFTGNTDLCVVGTPRKIPLEEFLANYDFSMQEFYAAFQGLPVSVVGSPAMHDNVGYFPHNGDPALNHQYQNECNQFGWIYNSSADASLSPGHVFTYTRNSVPVRTPDGIHLTPQGEQYYGVDLLR